MVGPGYCAFAVDGRRTGDHHTLESVELGCGVDEVRGAVDVHSHTLEWVCVAVGCLVCGKMDDVRWVCVCNSADDAFSIRHVARHRTYLTRSLIQLWAGSASAETDQFINSKIKQGSTGRRADTAIRSGEEDSFHSRKIAEGGSADGYCTEPLSFHHASHC